MPVRALQVVARSGSSSLVIAACYSVVGLFHNFFLLPVAAGHRAYFWFMAVTSRAARILLPCGLGWAHALISRVDLSKSGITGL